MKRGISVLFAVVLVISLTACSAKDSVQSEKTDIQEETELSAEDDSDETEPVPSGANSNILIAYFSVPEDVDTSDVDNKARLLARSCFVYNRQQITCFASYPSVTNFIVVRRKHGVHFH